MKRTYTNIGAEFRSEHAREAISEGQINRAIEGLTWEEVHEGMSLPMAQGEGLKSCIKELRIPKVTHVAYMGVILGHYGFYGVRGHYKNGTAEVYLMDSGCSITVMASDYHENICLIGC